MEKFLSEHGDKVLAEIKDAISADVGKTSAEVISRKCLNPSSGSKGLLQIVSQITMAPVSLDQGNSNLGIDLNLAAPSEQDSMDNRYNGSIEMDIFRIYKKPRTTREVLVSSDPAHYSRSNLCGRSLQLRQPTSDDGVSDTTAAGVMSEVVKFVVYYGFGNVRTTAIGDDLSEFQSVELEMSHPQRRHLSQFKGMLTLFFGLNPEIYTISLQALWRISSINNFSHLKVIDRTSQWVGWLKGCERRRTSPIALMLPKLKEIVGEPRLATAANQLMGISMIQGMPQGSTWMSGGNKINQKNFAPQQDFMGMYTTSLDHTQQSQIGNHRHRHESTHYYPTERHPTPPHRIGWTMLPPRGRPSH